MAAAPLPLITLEEYLHTDYRPDCDFVDGYLEERTLGELAHSTLQAELCYYFRQHREDWHVKVLSELRTRVSSSRVRIPDICLIRLDAPREPVTLTAPLLCIEILSPEDRLSRVTNRLEDFAGMGVEHIWIVDPERRLAYTYTRGKLSAPLFDQVTIAGTPIFLDLPTLFATLD